MNDGEFRWMPPVPNEYRLHKLRDGDIFTYDNITFEYEDKLFYRVVEDGRDEFFNTKWVRTGEVFTSEDINNFKKLFKSR